jgi:hypothetical protein
MPDLIVPSGVSGLNATYGNPRGADGKLSASWRAANIIAMPIPWPAPYNKMRLAWDTDTVVSTIAIHRLVAPSLSVALKAVWDTARQRIKERDGYDETTEYYDRQTMALLSEVGMNLYGGGFNFRLKRGGSSLSTHAYGCAIDIDPERNGMGDTTPALPLWIVAEFESLGWVWGGRWKGKNCDGMHFQYAKNV